MAAKLIDPSCRNQFNVVVHPNLCGDILIDEAAQIQGGVGTVGSANIEKRYVIFEAIHGTVLRMVKEGHAKYANPMSMIKAGAMMLEHIGFGEEAEEAKRLNIAIDICNSFERKIVITGHPDGATGEEIANYQLCDRNPQGSKSRRGAKNIWVGRNKSPLNIFLLHGRRWRWGIVCLLLFSWPNNKPYDQSYYVEY